MIRRFLAWLVADLPQPKSISELRAEAARLGAVYTRAVARGDTRAIGQTRPAFVRATHAVLRAEMGVKS